MNFFLFYAFFDSLKDLFQPKKIVFWSIEFFAESEIFQKIIFFLKKN
jgi:hypothetical protein